MPLPPEVSALLEATEPAARDAAWARFVGTYSRLLLHAARSVARDRDAAMDGYAYALEQLRGDDFHRLRGFASDGRSKFTTWLVVVVRRLCLDEARRRYGRKPQTGEAGSEAHAARRRLVDHVVEQIEVAELADPSGSPPDVALRAAELNAALAAAVATLEPADRLLLAFRFEDGLSAREIAPLVRMPTPFHVYRRLNALLERLRGALGERGVTEAEP